MGQTSRIDPVPAIVIREAVPSDFARYFDEGFRELSDHTRHLRFFTAVRELPGVVRTRRLCSIAGWAKHGVFYEFTSLEMRNAHFLPHEDAHPEIKAYSDVMVQKLTHAPASSTLATRLWPPVAAGAK